MLTSPAQTAKKNAPESEGFHMSAAKRGVNFADGPSQYASDLEVPSTDMFQVIGGEKALAPNYVSNLVEQGAAGHRLQ